MVVKKQVKKTAIKKRTKKTRSKKKLGKFQTSKSFQHGVLSDSNFVHFKFSKSYIVSIAAGKMDLSTFMVNDIWDPEFVVQPANSVYGFTQWAAFYQRARTHGSRLTLEMLPFSGAQADVANYSGKMFIGCAGDALVGPTSRDQFEDMKYHKDKYFNLFEGFKKMSMYVNTRQLFGKTKQQYNDDELSTQAIGSGISGRPGRQAYWYVGIWNPSVVNQPLTVHFTINIDYYTELYQRTVFPITSMGIGGQSGPTGTVQIETLGLPQSYQGITGGVFYTPTLI